MQMKVVIKVVILCNEGRYKERLYPIASKTENQKRKRSSSYHHYAQMETNFV